MSKYYPGLVEALEQVEKMTLEECLEHIDILYGRSYLPFGATEQEVRAECRRQIREDFTDFNYEGYFGEKPQRNY